MIVKRQTDVICHFNGHTLLMKKLIATFGLLLFTALTFGQETKYVNTEELNVRSGAGSKYDVVQKLSRGDKIIVVSTEGKWSEVELPNGTKGYVSSKFLSDSSSSKSPTSSKKSPWVGYLLLIGFIIYGLNKVFKFFGGSSSSSSSSQRQTRTQAPKVKPLRWYHCKNCNIKIEAGKQPTSLNCSAETFHKWTDLGEVGNQAYSCQNCGTTVYTTKQPTSLNCSRNTFHKWTKLS
jgi:uncharacterized protein YraI